ncbi:nicotinate-nicotinamide nucleotide adenylyltransferase [Endozoicomonas sp. OPT23]|uniref:adenylyltransferase/cytidyltransferase family protein n=1 Tax=Endozoicomonas sp. OPT23 TaxID=2072845 RepID=UPI00129BDA1F|nr:adenylyltransferase/cytidyltransferase family protein [Endozoicomonas sp. OPT23]MRI33323.1 nicotinate-nicotinamide nucleotide adenylyltransferase [Endozoicomonas sp. OPT23]
MMEQKHMKFGRIGIFGSAFNPPTLGHLDVIEQAAKEFDCILLMPSAAHAFAKDMQPFQHRLSMAEHFVNEAEVDECQLEASAIEAELLRANPDKPVYTYDLLCYLEKLYPEAELGFIRGPDNAAPETWNRFYKAAEIENRWQLFTASERLNIRSTKVRELVAEGIVKNKEALKPLLFSSVYQYILDNGLYQQA